MSSYMIIGLAACGGMEQEDLELSGKAEVTAGGSPQRCKCFNNDDETLYLLDSNGETATDIFQTQKTRPGALCFGNNDEGSLDYGELRDCINTLETPEVYKDIPEPVTKCHCSCGDFEQDKVFYARWPGSDIYTVAFFIDPADFKGNPTIDQKCRWMDTRPCEGKDNSDGTGDTLTSGRLLSCEPVTMQF